jgi:hypothetical protein
VSSLLISGIEGKDPHKQQQAMLIPNEMTVALDNLRKSYERFNKKKKLYSLDSTDLLHAMRAADIQKDLRTSAIMFKENISDAIQTTIQIQEIENQKWTVTLAGFLTKFYQLTRLSLQMTSAIAEVR